MAIYHSHKEFLHSLEHFNALSSPKHHWLSSHSEKPAVCAFGCDIPAEETFFKKPLDAEGEHATPVCWDCMEKMVYLTIDTDLHTRELTRRLKHEQHPHAPRHPLPHPMHY